MIAVTGATGFTGSQVCRLLAERGIAFRAIIRDPGKAAPLQLLGGDVAIATFEDAPALVQALRGCDRLLNIASLGFGHAQAFVDAARVAGVRRAVFVSTTALFTRLPAPTKQVRQEAERTIMESGLDWTIIRPTMIYGTASDRNIYRLLRVLKRSPVIPVAGDGRRLQQPVHVTDVATAVIDAGITDRTVERAYNIAGREPLSFNDLIDTAATAVGRRVLRLHIPFGLVTGLVQVYERLSPRPRLKLEQVLRLAEDKAFDYSEATQDFGYRPLSFAEGVQRMVAELRAEGLL